MKNCNNPKCSNKIAKNFEYCSVACFMQAELDKAGIPNKYGVQQQP